jgi:serine/threonine-protein kinase
MSPHSTIAHYRIIGKLGAGGMGEVWRATDTKLGRDVAIKILPETFAADPDRMARFSREAQVLASLNHPNIAAIYGVEERALVMELVEGPTLADRIARGAIPLEESLPIARQIADALEYAHDHSVIHRDLKPANIKITPDGRVKILDFGLAKALSTEAAAGDPASSPTLTMRATMAGTVMGTAAYMSPEQARGHDVDRRADIWAFGVVLYEMLTGRRPFAGATISDTLASVLKEEPDWERLPSQVRRLLRLCLAKDPRRRLRDVGDARALIDDAPDPQAAAPARRGVPQWVAGLLAAALLATGVFLWRATRPQSRPLMRLNVDLGAGAVAGSYTTVCISPDGTRLAYSVRDANGGQQLATRLLSQSKATVLPGTIDATDPFFSPDGESIGFFAEGRLKTVSVQGGAPITLASAPSSRGGSWSSDGTILAALSLTGVARVPASGGTPQLLTKLEETGQFSHRWPQVLPGGKAVLFSAGVPGNFEDASIEVVSLTTGQQTTVLRGGFFGRYLPGGYLVYMHQGTLYGIGFDLSRMSVRGSAVQLLDDVAPNPTGGSAQIDFSQTGAVVYLTGSGAMQSRRLAWLDSSGAIQPLAAQAGPYLTPSVSPDGSQVALWGAQGGPLDLWAYDWQRNLMSRLTFGAQTSRTPVWAPDGKHIAFASPGFIGWVRADGAGGEQRLLETASLALPASISPDGRRLAYYQFTSKSDFDIWTVSLDLADPDHPKAGKPELFLGTPAAERNPAFSPDGRWIAYDSSESGHYEVNARPFPPGSAKRQVSAGGGQFPSWSRDGRRLFYETMDGQIMVADCTVKGDSFEAGRPRLWSPRRVPSTSPYPNLSPHPDGKRFLVFADPAGSADAVGSVHATFLLNFIDELKRRIP